jgi:aspartokinase
MRDAMKNVETVEARVDQFLYENPDFFVSLREGIVNVSKLAQLITRNNQDLNLISVRSTLNRLKKNPESTSGKNSADSLLKKSRVSLQDKICVVTARSARDMKYISATYLQDSIVYIVDEMKSWIPEPSQVISIDRDVSMIHILSPKEIEKTPGFVMRITNKLFARGINILQLISCSNETIIILARKDSTTAYDILT